MSLPHEVQEVLSSFALGMSLHETAKEMNKGEGELRELWSNTGRLIVEMEPRTTEEWEMLATYYRVQSEMHAREHMASEARLSALMDIAPEAILVINGRTGEIVRANNQAFLMLGYSPRDLIGATMEMLVPPEIQKIHVSYRTGFLSSMRKREMGYHPPVLAVRKDGSTILLDIGLTATPASDEVMAVCCAAQQDAGQERQRSG